MTKKIFIPTAEPSKSRIWSKHFLAKLKKKNRMCLPSVATICAVDLEMGILKNKERRSSITIKTLSRELKREKICT